MLLVVLEEAAFRHLDVALGWFLSESRLSGVAAQSLRLRGFQLREHHASATLTEHSSVFFHCGGIARIIERPDIRENRP
jgi:hypothetical protein